MGFSGRRARGLITPLNIPFCDTIQAAKVETVAVNMQMSVFSLWLLLTKNIRFCGKYSFTYNGIVEM